MQLTSKFAALAATGVLVFSMAAQAQSTKVLLDCNISFGPNQAVRVLETETGLVLEELTNTGSFQRRALLQEEWASKKLGLRIESLFDKGSMTLQTDGNWYYTFGGSYGYASCSK